MPYFIKRCKKCNEPIHVHFAQTLGRHVYFLKNVCDHFKRSEHIVKSDFNLFFKHI